MIPNKFRTILCGIFYFYKMKTFALFLFLSVSLFTGNLFGQNINEDLLKQNFVKQYIKLLEKKYQPERSKIQISENLKNDLKTLKKEYDSRLQQVFPPTPTERNAVKQAVRNYYTYYPDVAAIFTNRNNQFDMKVSDDDKTKYNTMLVDIWKKIPNPIFAKVSDITDKLKKEKIQLTIPYNYEFYRNFSDDGLRKRDDVINFLLWNLE